MPVLRASLLAGALAVGVGLILFVQSQAPRPQRGKALAPVTPGAGAPDLVLVLNVDTLRRDRLGVYGNTRRLTPAWDALGQAGLVFDWAFSSSNHTRPSVASLMTGRTAGSHGLWTFDSQLDVYDQPNLGNLFRALGYRTLLATANPNTNFGDSFDLAFEERPPLDSAWAHDYYPADELLTHAWRLVERSRFPERLFMYVHLADPHGPYLPRTYDHDLFADDPIGRDFPPDLSQLRVSAATAGITSDQLQNVRNRYDAEVRFADQESGRFLDRLLARYPRALLIITADHGEAFLEHGDVGHGTSLYNTQVHLPLLIRDTTGRLRQGARVPVLTANYDLLPFLAEYFGVAVEADGESFLPWIDAAQTPPSTVSRTIRIESFYDLRMVDGDAPDLRRLGRPVTRADDPYVVAVLRQRRTTAAPELWKGLTGWGPDDVMAAFTLISPHRRELYELQRDPDERANRFSTEPAVRAWIADATPNPPPVPVNAGPGPSAEMLERLRALGYVGRGSGGR